MAYDCSSLRFQTCFVYIMQDKCFILTLLKSIVKIHHVSYFFKMNPFLVQTWDLLYNVTYSYNPSLSWWAVVSLHYSDVLMSTVSQITSLTIVYSTVHSVADQRKHQSYVSLAFVMGIHRWLVNYPHKGPIMPKMFLFDDIIMGRKRIKLYWDHTVLIAN